MQAGAAFPPWLIWFLLGVLLAFLELQIPGFIVGFFAIGCWAVAATLLAVDLSAAQQIAIFIVASLASIVLLRRYLERIFRGQSREAPGDGLEDLPRGARVKVVQRITPQAGGRIQYRGTPWDAVADEEIAEGETVEIVGHADGSRLAFHVRKL